MYIPALGNKTPKTNSKIKKAIGQFLLWGYRWDIEGELHNTEKLMVILAPHTSYWDFLTNMATMLAIGVKNRWFIADSFWWWPVRIFWNWLGGVPVNRNAKHDLVSFTVSKFSEYDEMIMALYPEGTTLYAEKWKTGFWHIAKGAGIPIQLLAVDYKKRATVFGPVFNPSDDIYSDMKMIQEYFRDITPKDPERYGGEYF